MNLVFQFNSFSDFMMMSGHGPYVWAAYGITIAGFALLVLQARIRQKQVAKKIRLVSLRTQSTEQLG